MADEQHLSEYNGTNMLEYQQRDVLGYYVCVLLKLMEYLNINNPKMS